MGQCILVNYKIDAKLHKIEYLVLDFMIHQKQIYPQMADIPHQKCIIVQLENLVDFQEEVK